MIGAHEALRDGQRVILDHRMLPAPAGEDRVLVEVVIHLRGDEPRQRIAHQRREAQQPQAQQAAPADGWKCSCGAMNTGKFCTQCGAKKPESGWTCACGAVNQGKFCSQCGAKRPAGAPLYRCDKCGWQPEDPTHPPKFCPECGDPFDDNDLQ